MSSTLCMDDPPSALELGRDRAKAAFVIHLVAMTTGVPPTEIAREDRARNLAARARWLAIYLLHTALSVPLMRVAAVFGRDRTTVGQVVNRVEDWRTDAEFDRVVTALEACVLAAPAETPPRSLAAVGPLNLRRSEP